MTDAQDTRHDFYVYAYYRDGVPVYIGKGRDDRWLKHLNKARNRHLRAMIEMDHREGTISVTWAKVIEGVSEAEAYAAEIALIAQHGRRPAGTLVNHSYGGEGGSDGKALIGKKRKPETVEKMAAAKRGRKLTEEHKAKIAAKSKGRTLSTAARAKVSAARKGNQSRLGKRHSPETIEKMRLAQANRTHVPMSAETREKIRQAHLGRKHIGYRPRSAHSEETRAKMRLSQRKLGPKSEAVRDKISAALAGRKVSPEALAKRAATNAAKRVAAAER